MHPRICLVLLCSSTNILYSAPYACLCSLHQLVYLMSQFNSFFYHCYLSSVAVIVSHFKLLMLLLLSISCYCYCIIYLLLLLVFTVYLLLLLMHYLCNVIVKVFISCNLMLLLLSISYYHYCIIYLSYGCHGCIQRFNSHQI